MSDPEDSDSELKVTFYPPLFLQRRIWVLDILRHEEVSSILDIGCGEGELLTVLAQPSPWLSPPPPTILPPPPPSSSSSSPVQAPRDDIGNLHPTYIVGLDTSHPDLQFTIQNTAPPPPETRPHAHAHPIRWEPLEVKIWEGTLQSVNPEFIDADFDCIVSTEVIEHLPPSVLPDYAPIILGIYHPRIFLLTTPSYTFNARFTDPSAPPSARHGYPDPTHRTDRIFRHSDHKFEWTVQEFRAWCSESAEMWMYDVRVSSVGRAVEDDPWGRDEELGGASQVAVFTRLDDGESLRVREGRAGEVRKRLEEEKEGMTMGHHELLATHHHPSHPRSRNPASLSVIGEAVRKKMEELRESVMGLEELWFERSYDLYGSNVGGPEGVDANTDEDECEIGVLCGGWMEVLIAAIEETKGLLLIKDDPVKRTKWMVQLEDGLNTRMFPLEGETSLDYIPEGWIPQETDAAETLESPPAAGINETIWEEEETNGHWDEVRPGWEPEPDENEVKEVGWDVPIEAEEGFGVIEPESSSWGSSSWPEMELSPGVEELEEPAWGRDKTTLVEEGSQEDSPSMSAASTDTDNLADDHTNNLL